MLKIAFFKNTTLELVKALKNKIKTALNERFELSGRGERIRTFDTLVPNQVLYQTELRPENERYYNCIFIKIKYILLLYDFSCVTLLHKDYKGALL